MHKNLAYLGQLFPKIILRADAKDHRQLFDGPALFYDPPCWVRNEYPGVGLCFFGVLLYVVLGRYRPRYQKCSWYPFSIDI
jgi:hypothetical protein